MPKPKPVKRHKPKSKPKPKPVTAAIVQRIEPVPERPWLLTQEDVTIVKNSIAKGASDEELKFCLTVARRYKLDPFRQQIWFVKRWDSGADNGNGGRGAFVWTPQVGINGLLFTAARDHKVEFGSVGLPEYGPMQPIQWAENGKTCSGKAPEWASVKVWKKGETEPTEAQAWWDEYAPANLDKAPFWRKMPRRMIAKCAIALGIRQAYPDLGGLYIPEEIERMGQETTPEGRSIITQEETPKGPTEAQQQAANRTIEAKKALIEAHKASGGSQGQASRPAVDVNMAPKAPQTRTVVVTWPSKTSDIAYVSGDIAELLTPWIKETLHGEWSDKLKTYVLPAASVADLQGACEASGYKVRHDILAGGIPSAPPARVGEQGGSSAPTLPPLPVSSIVKDARLEADGKRMSVLYNGVWLTCFHRSLFEHLQKSKGQVCEFAIAGRPPKIEAILRIGATEFLDGVPVIQQRER